MKYLAAFILSLIAMNTNAACNGQADKLIKAYPDHLVACENNFLIWKEGEKQIFDDGEKKDFDALLENADSEDMFHFPYPVGDNSYSPPELNVDPGRIRNAAFFKKMYGATKAEVESHLVTIQWMGQKSIQVNSVNGIDKKLMAISAELMQLPPELKKYVINTAGTFNWRTISGTQRLSGHSFAIAIDINTQFSNYWQWAKKPYAYHNQIPKQIVEVFEKQGFIWGGKWYHYDTMHFEYRPELLIKP